MWSGCLSTTAVSLYRLNRCPRLRRRHRSQGGRHATQRPGVPGAPSRCSGAALGGADGRAGRAGLQRRSPSPGMEQGLSRASVGRWSSPGAPRAGSSARPIPQRSACRLMRPLVSSCTSPAAMAQDPVHASSTDPDIRLLRAAHARTYNKTPSSAFPLLTGSVWHSLRSAPGRIASPWMSPACPRIDRDRQSSLKEDLLRPAVRDHSFLPSEYVFNARRQVAAVVVPSHSSEFTHQF